MRKNLRLTIAEIVVIVAASVIAAALVVSKLGHGGLGRRSTCSNNLRSIVQAMTIYAQMNAHAFPAVMPPHRPGTYENVIAADVGDANQAFDVPDLLSKYYPSVKMKRSACAQRGSPSACLWLLVATGQITPKTFICPQDPFAAKAGPCVWFYDADSDRLFVDNFGLNRHGKPMPSGAESYSIADPWRGVRMASYWNDGGGSDIPIACDMAPSKDMRAKGKLKRDPAAARRGPKDYRLFNSSNHNGDGQNVAFADDHVSFHTDPFAGQNGDNIFTWDGNVKANPATGGKVPTVGKTAKGPRSQNDANNHIDTVMMPVRDPATGGT